MLRAFYSVPFIGLVDEFRSSCPVFREKDSPRKPLSDFLEVFSSLKFDKKISYAAYSGFWRYQIYRQVGRR